VERKEREATSKERRAIETRFYGLDALYDRYSSYRSLLKSNTRLSGMGMTPAAVGTSLGTQPTLNKMRAELEADLIKSGFPGGIADLEKLIGEYEQVFERGTLAVARVMLDQYEHVLWKEARRYKDTAETDALHAAVSQTKESASGEAEKESSVVSAHPLVGNPDFDRERLAHASKSEVRALMLGYIAARRKDIADTRKSLEAKPTMIYGLDALLSASYQAHNIKSGTTFDKIIRNHISDVHWSEAIPQLILAVIAIAAGLLTGGGGAVAILAGGTALGIGSYQVIEEFRRYEMKSAAHGAQLASDEPSMAWVIVAVIGAGFDAAAFASVLPKLRPALQAFNAGAEAGDVTKLAQKLDKLTEVEEGIRKSIVRAAEAEAEARAAWKAVFRPPAALRMVIIPGAEEFGRFVYAVYLTIKRGILDFNVFVKTNEAIALIGDVTKLPVEDLAKLKIGYLEAIKEMETVAAHGKNVLQMSDDEIRAFMNLRGNTKGMSVEQVMKEMDAWSTAKSSGVPFGFKNAEQFMEFQKAASDTLSKLLKRADPKAEAFLQGSAVSGVSYKRHLPFDIESDFDVAISSKYLFEKARKLGYKVKDSPSRIGPLSLDDIHALGLGKFHKNLHKVIAEEASAAGGAAPSGATREIHIMFFDKTASVTKPIGSVSKEVERATLPLKVK